MAPSIKVTGDAEIARSFEALARDVGDMRDAHQRVAELLVPGASRRSPRRTGALAASWQAEATKVAASVVSGVEYAGPVEYGQPSRGIPGARMVADTIAAEVDAITGEYERHIEERGKARGLVE